jgi:hypothetical protein
LGLRKRRTTIMDKAPPEIIAQIAKNVWDRIPKY